MKLFLSKANLLWILLGILFLATSCGSLEKANSLYRDGKNAEALSMAQGFLDDGDPMVRIQAVKLVAQIGGEEAGKSLVPLLDDEVMDVKAEAARGIGKTAYAPAADKLVTMVPESKGSLLDAVAEAVRGIGTPAVDLVIYKLDSPSTQNKEIYRDFLIMVGPKVAEAVAKSLKGKSAFESEGKFQILVAIKNPKTAHYLVDYVDDAEVGHLVKEGLVKLGSMAGPAVLSELTKRSEDTENKAPKLGLVEVLGDLKYKEAIPLLEKLTQDPSDQVRAAADRSLTKIRGF